MVLSAVTVKQAKPKEKKYVLKDEKGLYLEISPTGFSEDFLSKVPEI